MVAWERQLPVFWGLKLGRVMPLLIETVYVNVKMIAGYVAGTWHRRCYYNYYNMG